LDDHVNPESAHAAARIAELYEKYNLKVDFYPIGLSLQMYMQCAPEAVETLKSLEMPINYHGVTHYRFPVMRQRIGDKDWDEAVQEAIYCETYRLNPFKALIDNSQLGGIGLITEVFGLPPTLAIPRVRAASAIHAMKIMGVKMLSAQGGPMLGWPLYWNLGMLQGRGGPGNYSFMPNLITSQVEAGLFGPHTVWEDARPPSDPITIIQNIIDYAPRDRVNLISFAWHPFQFVVKAGAPGWGGNMYRGVRNPEDLPDHYIGIPVFSPEETDAIFAEHEKLIKFVSENSELTPVTALDLLNMVEPLPNSRSVSMQNVTKIAESLTTFWVNYPPEYVSVGEEHYSLADVFQALAFSLGHYSREGQFPDKVTIGEILGPTDTPISLGLPYRRVTFLDIPRTVVSGKEVLETVLKVQPEITQRIPSVIYLTGCKLRDEGAARAAAKNVMETENIARSETSYFKSVLNPGEFLYLMAQVVQNLARTGEAGDVMLIAGSVVPGGEDVSSDITKQEWHSWLQRWTIKPAILKPEYKWLLE